MNAVLLKVFLLISVALSVFISSPIPHWGMAQMQNTTLPENTNNTRMVLNLKDKTVTLINATTNETISVKPTTETRENITSNETLPGSVGNITSNETLPGSVGNITSNETLPGSVGNMTSNINLTEKFGELGK
jgi:hypothetical protein